MLTGDHKKNFLYMMTLVVELPWSTTTTFEEEAYGAVLTVVYLRAMPLGIRTDIHRRLMNKGCLWGGKTPPGMTLEQIKGRRAFYGRLNSLMMETFQWATFDAVTNADDPSPYQAEPLLYHPWSLSDSEFADGINRARHGKMPDMIADEPEESPSLEQSKGAVAGVLKHEYIEYMAEFLQEAAEDLTPVLKTGVKFTARASLISALFETLNEIGKTRRIELLKDLFERDEPRRVFLKSIGWGSYEKKTISAPTAPSYVGSATSRF